MGVCLGGAVEKHISVERAMQQARQQLRSSSLAGHCQDAAPPLTIGLVPHAQDDFGGAVVAGDYVGCHQEASGSCPGQAKVQDLQCAVGLHHNVAGLQVLDRKHNTNLINAQVVVPLWCDMVVFCSER